MKGMRLAGPGVVLAVALAALAAGSFSMVAIGVLSPELRAELGLSRAEIGLVTALSSAGAAVASRRAGVLTDTAQPALVLRLSLLLYAASVTLAALAPHGYVVLVAFFFAGIAYGSISPATNVVIAGSSWRRLGLFMSVKQTGIPIGGFLAGVILPPVALALSWRWALGLGAVIALGVAWASVLLRGARVLEVRAAEAEPAEPYPRREVIAIGLYGGVMAGTQWAFLTYLVLYLTDGHGWSLRTAGLGLSLATAFSVAGRLFWGWFSDRPGRRVSALLTAAAIAAGMLVLLAAGVGGAVLWPIVAATGLALVGWNGAYHALVTDRAGIGRVGRAAGEAMAFVFSGTVVLPPLLGLVSQATDSWSLLWALGAGLVVAAAAILWLGLRDRGAKAAATALRRAEAP
jgi:MFS family permease